MERSATISPGILGPPCELMSMLMFPMLTSDSITCVYNMYVYNYTYIYIYIEREIQREKEIVMIIIIIIILTIIRYAASRAGGGPQARRGARRERISA